MPKPLIITEKPSVAREFANALKLNGQSKDGYIEADRAVVTWCVGHLVSMSYPDVYDPELKKWTLESLPFIPDTFLYEVIPNVKKQFDIVKSLLEREDIDKIYVCTDAGREGEYIFRLVDQMADTDSKEKLRVWIDSQTEDEIRRGIRDAKPLSEYDNLAASAYLRAKEDYLMGINFSRALTLKYSWGVKKFLNSENNIVIAVGRVMTCVLGMVVERERAIRNFVKLPFFRVIASTVICAETNENNESLIDLEWKLCEKSRYVGSPYLYKENGFTNKELAEQLVQSAKENASNGVKAKITNIEKKKETKKPPLFFNLAELQNICSRQLKLSPDQTLRCTQELYEKKLVTYPRTDARVISTAVCKEISKNLNGLCAFPGFETYAKQILNNKLFVGLEKTKYVNDKAITDHYAIIPTGQAVSTYRGLSGATKRVFDLICCRFLSVFFPAAEYRKFAIHAEIDGEKYISNFKVCEKRGYLEVAELFDKDNLQTNNVQLDTQNETSNENQNDESNDVSLSNEAIIEQIKKLKVGTELDVNDIYIKEGETSPPKRYNSGSIILAMENAGQLIENEELREQIKGSGIGTSATRAEILKKLINVNYLNLNPKTQIISATQIGEMIYDVVNHSIQALLNPQLTASWEKGLGMVNSGEITADEYLIKLNDFVASKTQGVIKGNNTYKLNQCYAETNKFYAK